jgi:hypothetical protein
MFPTQRIFDHGDADGALRVLRHKDVVLVSQGDRLGIMALNGRGSTTAGGGKVVIILMK